MKKILLFIVIVLTNGLIVSGQTNVKDVYEFPIKPETEEWERFEMVSDRIAALQIPDAVLATISTEGLLETCLTFPYLLDMFLCNNYQQGFDLLMTEFNGFREFFNRRDLANIMLKKYGYFIEDVKGIRLLKDVEQGWFTFRYFVLEFMLAQDAVFKNLNEEQEMQFLTVYPNPANDILHVEINSSAKDLKGNPTYDIRLYDISGNMVRNTVSQNSHVQFNVSNMQNGFYFLHVYDGANSKPEIKVVVIKH